MNLSVSQEIDRGHKLNYTSLNILDEWIGSQLNPIILSIQGLQYLLIQSKQNYRYKGREAGSRLQGMNYSWIKSEKMRIQYFRCGHSDLIKKNYHHTFLENRQNLKKKNKMHYSIWTD